MSTTPWLVGLDSVRRSCRIVMSQLARSNLRTRTVRPERAATKLFWVKVPSYRAIHLMTDSRSTLRSFRPPCRCDRARLADARIGRPAALLGVRTPATGEYGYFNTVTAQCVPGSEAVHPRLTPESPVARRHQDRQSPVTSLWHRGQCSTGSYTSRCLP